MIAPLGITAPDSPLPEHRMSGTTPKVWAANMSPVLPKPVSTSSKISSTLWRLVMSRRMAKYSSVGVTIPPVLQIGSTSTAATVSGFSLTMISSNSRAQKRLVSSQLGKRSRSWIGEKAFRKPGMWGSNLTLRLAPPLADMAARVPPW